MKAEMRDSTRLLVGMSVERKLADLPVDGPTSYIDSPVAYARAGRMHGQGNIYSARCPQSQR